MNAFIKSQFGYCPLICFSCSKCLIVSTVLTTSRKEHYKYTLHLKCYLKNIILTDSRNLQVLATKVYKHILQLSPNIIQERFNLIENRYKLRRNKIFATKSSRPQKQGIESLVYLALKNLVVSVQEHQKFCHVKYFQNQNKSKIETPFCNLQDISNLDYL